MKSKNIIIIGSGFAGMTCAIYLAKAGEEVTILGDWSDSSIISSPKVENYPGVGTLDGPSIIFSLFSQMESFKNIECISNSCKKVIFSDELNGFILLLEDGEELFSRIVVVATGRKPRMLGVPGEEELLGKGLSTCAYCDGNLYSGKEVILVGGGVSAIEEAEYLLPIVSKLEILVRKPSFKYHGMEQTLLSHPQSNKLTLSYLTEVESLSKEGDKINVLTKSGDRKTCDGIFYAIGSIPNTEFLQGVCPLDEEGYVKVGANGMAIIQSRTKRMLAACGDVSSATSGQKQAIVASADGAKVALNILKHL